MILKYLNRARIVVRLRRNPKIPEMEAKLPATMPSVGENATETLPHFSDDIFKFAISFQT